VLEREAEVEAVEELIGASTRGGWLLAIEGSPGIGKTAPLTHLGECFELRMLSEMRTRPVRRPLLPAVATPIVACQRAISRENARIYA
jgi:hypothetical protein